MKERLEKLEALLPEDYICPTCENEEFSAGAKFCKICGTAVKCEGA